jgi:F-type H+-transporting ATPase subunit delta
LRALFENPAFGSEVRRDVLVDLAAQAGLHEQVRDLLRLLADRRRLRHVPQVREAFDAMLEAKSGKVRAEVTTAAELPEAYFAELGRTLASVLGREVTIVKKVDPNLIGGVVTQVGDQVFDGSLRNRLGELRDELLR